MIFYGSDSTVVESDNEQIISCDIGMLGIFKSKIS